jgi:hypothetical protein
MMGDARFERVLDELFGDTARKLSLRVKFWLTERRFFCLIAAS